MEMKPLNAHVRVFQYVPHPLWINMLAHPLISYDSCSAKLHSKSLNYFMYFEIQILNTTKEFSNWYFITDQNNISHWHI
jgi:hypothetical protein